MLGQSIPSNAHTNLTPLPPATCASWAPTAPPFPTLLTVRARPPWTISPTGWP